MVDNPDDRKSGTAPKTAERLASLDAYRGFVMLLMMAEVLRFCEVANARPDSAFWRFLCHHQSHSQWVGCSLYDLIQPSFSFLVGVVLPFSIASRQARGQTFGAMTRHALVRAVALVVLGIVNLSTHPRQVTWEFVDTLTQIGLGYGFLFLVAFRPCRDRWVVLALILFGYWLAFALYPLPGPDFDYAQAVVPEEWLKEHGLTGFAAHWQKNSNLAWAFDTWFLNLFPRGSPYVGHPDGLTTLNAIPLLGTMILGLAAGDVLRSNRRPWAKVRWLIVAGAIGLSAGWLLGAAGACPVAKPIWTPSWVLFSGGWCCLLLAAFYALVDVERQRAWAFPLVVIGMNSITAYFIANIFETFAFNGLRRIFGRKLFSLFGDAYEPLFYGIIVLAGFWLVLLAMHRRKIFMRI